MERAYLVSCGVLGALGVGLGAFGAHGLEGALAGTDDLARKLEWWDTAVLYQLLHVLALGLSQWLGSRHATAAGRRPARVAGAAFLFGVALFSGTLYAMALGAPRWLGAITPLGGVSLMVGWLCVALSAARSTTSSPGS